MHAASPTDLDPALAQWRRLSAELAEELLSLPDEHARVLRVRELALADEPLSVARALLGEARASARSDSVRMATLARYAVLALEEIDPALHPPALRAGLLASAWCSIGNASRLARCYGAAETAFARAASHLATIIPGDLEARALYLSLLSKLRRDQRRLAEAEELLHQADILREAVPSPGRHGLVLL
jgi:hypothetical protein